MQPISGSDRLLGSSLSLPAAPAEREWYGIGKRKAKGYSKAGGRYAENYSRPGGPGSWAVHRLNCAFIVLVRPTRHGSPHTLLAAHSLARREPCYTVMQGLACNHTQVWVSSLWSYRRGSLAASTYSCRASEGSCSRTASAADSAGAWPPGRTARVGRGSTGCRPTRRPARCACPD